MLTAEQQAERLVNLIGSTHSEWAEEFAAQPATWPAALRTALARKETCVERANPDEPAEPRPLAPLENSVLPALLR